MNNGDGTVTKNTTRLPAVIKYGTNGSQPDLTCTSNCSAQIYTTELIDFNNTRVPDAWLCSSDYEAASISHDATRKQ